jgi:hypothetical protein
MDNNNSRMLMYLSIMALLFGCIVFGYSLFFFGFGIQKPAQGALISPSFTAVAGVIISSVMGIASGILSDQLGDHIKSMKSILRIGIPLIVFLAALALTIFITLLNM